MLKINNEYTKTTFENLKLGELFVFTITDIDGLYTKVGNTTGYIVYNNNGSKLTYDFHVSGKTDVYKAEIVSVEIKL